MWSSLASSLSSLLSAMLIDMSNYASPQMSVSDSFPLAALVNFYHASVKLSQSFCASLLFQISCCCDVLRSSLFHCMRSQWHSSLVIFAIQSTHNITYWSYISLCTNDIHTSLICLYIAHDSLPMIHANRAVCRISVTMWYLFFIISSGRFEIYGMRQMQKFNSK